MVEDVGNQPYLGGAWVYDISSGRPRPEVAAARPEPVHAGSAGLPDPGRGDVRDHPGAVPRRGQVPAWTSRRTTTSRGELVQGGQLLELKFPPGKFG